MAKQYYAVNEIRHGDKDGELKVFAPDQQVTGLDKDTMVQLWQAGVLREVDPDNLPPDPRDAEIQRLEAQIEAMKAEKEAADKAAAEAPRDANEVPGVGSVPTANTPQAAVDMAGTIGNPVSNPDGSTEEQTGPDSE